MTDEQYMAAAINEARKAEKYGEIPIGCIIVCDDEIVGRGHNLRERIPDATAHAEIIAIRDACQQLGRWRLNGCTLYVTVEPCPMCAGAIVHSRIDRLVYGADDNKTGAVYSIMNITTHPALNHEVEIRAGVCEETCRDLVKKFFRKRRTEDKK